MPLPLIVAVPAVAGAVGLGTGFALSDEAGKTLRFALVIGATIVVLRYRKQIFKGGG